MGSRFARFRHWSQTVLGGRHPSPARPAAKPVAGGGLVRLEDRTTPATFTVTNILDNQVDVVGGFSLRQAILAANATPGFDTINFNIPVSPSLPKRLSDNTNYFPIILASTLPDLTDVAGVQIDAGTQPRPQIPNPDVQSTVLTVDDPRPIIQLLPDPNPGAFPGSKGAFYITGNNNVVRGFVITGFPGSGVNIASGKNNIILGNYINTDIEGTKAWYQDQILSTFRVPGLANEITNDTRGTVLAGITLLGTGTGTQGAQNNVVGGLYDRAGVSLVNAVGDVIGFGGAVTRSDGTVIPVTESYNRNIISGTPEYRRDLLAARERDIIGAGVGPGIRFMDPFTRYNLVQGNFIGTDVTGLVGIPNENGIEFVNGAISNYVGNPTQDGPGKGSSNLIRFNTHDGAHVAQTPNFARPDQTGPAVSVEFAHSQYYNDLFVGQRFLPRYYDAYSENYYEGQPSASSGITPSQILQLAVPNPTSVNPPLVPGTAGSVGTKVTIHGRNLAGLTGVAFRGINNTLVQARFTVVDDATIIATVPEGAVSGVIRLFGPGGTQDSPNQFFVQPSPTPVIDLSSVVAPGNGKVGETVTISGTGFFGVISVTFGQTPASVFTESADGKTITAVVPFGATTGLITVTVPGSAVSTVNPFVVETTAPPNVAAFSPAEGVPGQEITITGSGFTGAGSVIFNFSGATAGFSSSTLTIVDDNTIKVKVPLNATPSVGPVEILGAGGNTISAATFRILAPNPVSISGFVAQPPGASSGSGGVAGTRVVVSGAGFTSATGLSFGGVADTRFKVLDDNTIEGFAPVGGNGPIAVSVPGAQAVSAGAFAVTATPGSSVTAVQDGRRNTFVTVTGTNLLGVQFVRFDQNNPINDATLKVGFPTDIRNVTPTSFEVRVPNAATGGQIFVYTASSLATGVAGNFNLIFTSQPTIDTAKLASPRDGVVGQLLTITGQGLLGTQHVTFAQQGGGTVDGVFTVINDRSLTVIVPPQAVTGPIRVVSPGGVDTTADFVVTTPPAPTILSLSPATGTVGTVLTITGTGFTSATTVVVGGIPTSPGTLDTPGAFEILSDVQVRVRVPSGAATGVASVQVAGGASVASAGVFTVTPSAAPTIAFITPGGVRNAGVTIQGTGLLGTSTVLFNGVPSPKVTIASDRQIVAVVPISATTGVVTILTPGGTVVSSQIFQVVDSQPPLFNSLIPVGAAVPSDGRPDLQIQPAGPRGTRLFINGDQTEGVYRIEFSTASGTGTTPAEFVRLNGSLMVTVPQDAVTGAVSIYASSKDQASGGNLGGASFGGRWDTTQYNATNLLGQPYTYGETFEVLPNPRPVVTAAVFDNGVSVRGSYLVITGSGFLGAERVDIAGEAHTQHNLVYAGSKVDRNSIGYGEFEIQDDNTIITKLATSGGVFTGPAGFTGDVYVYGPDVTAADKSLTFATIDVSPTVNLTFTTAGFSPGPFNGGGFQYAGPPVNAFWGSQIDLIAKTGSFFGTESVTYAGFVSPVIAVSADGRTITTVINGNIPIPDPPPPPPNVPPFVPQLPLDPVVRYIGGQAIGSSNGGDSVRLFRTEAPTAVALSPTVNGSFIISRDIVFIGTNLLGTTSVVFATINRAGLPSAISIQRSELGLNDVTGGSVRVTLPVGVGTSNGLKDLFINEWVTGAVTVVTQKGTAAANFTPQAQPQPDTVTFVNRRAATIDNRITGNVISGNGNTDPAQAKIDGDFAIDFVTDYCRFRGPPELQCILGIPGNEARGGMDDTFPYSSFPNTTFPNSYPFDTIVAPFDNDIGPNNLQNFPLLQVVQSTVDRTTLSTALISRALHPYRIDYYYNPDFRGTETTATNTQIIPQAQVWLGSRVITTDRSGNGSISNTIYRPLPNADGTITPPADGELRLPNDLPLPVGAVITATATDLADAQANGASAAFGPDGTSRLSFFSETITTTGGVSGQVVNDKNNNGAFDTDETGVAGYTVSLFVDKGDGTLSATPVVNFVTDDSGLFDFSPGSFDTDGFGLPNGTHKLVVTAPPGGKLSVPTNGTRFFTIANGVLVPDVNFLVFGAATVPPGTSPPGTSPPGTSPPGTSPPGGVPPTSSTPFPKGIAVGADAGGAPTVNVLNADGSFRYGFSAYSDSFTGGVRVAIGDVNGDGDQDIVTAPGAGIAGVIKLYNGRTGAILAQFQPYEDAFTGGVYVAVGDVDGDGKADVITGTGIGGGPRVQVFRFDGLAFSTLANFFPYEDSFRGGVLVAAGDVNADGKADVVTGTGVGGGPRIQVFDATNLTGAPIYNFFAYENTFRGGVFASVGDVTGDGKADVLTGTGVGGGPVVKVFQQSNLTAARTAEPAFTSSFLAYDPLFRGGVRVDAVDGNADGRLDLLVSPGPGIPGVVRVIDFFDTANNIRTIQPFDPNFIGGVFVGGTHK